MVSMFRGRRGLLASLSAALVLFAGVASPALASEEAARASTESSAATLPATSGLVDPGSRVKEFALPDRSSLPSDVVDADFDAGSVWVSTFADRRVLRLDRDGRVTMTAQLTGGPSSLASDHDGGAWATEYASNAIAHITSDGQVTEYPIPTPNSYPAHIGEANDEFVFFTESNTGKLGRLSLATGVIEEFAIPGSETPWGVAVSSDEVWVTDRTFTAVLDYEGTLLSYVATPEPLTSVAFVASQGGGSYLWRGTSATGFYDITQGPAGALSLTDSYTGRTGIQGSTSLGRMTWFSDSASHTVGWRRVDGSVGEVELGAGDDLGALTTTERRYLWVVEKRSGVVARIDSAIAIEVDRIGGADRFEVAANVSQRYFSQASTVFVVSGEKFADALSAGPYAAHAKAPVLLTTRQTLPPPTRNELVRLHPRHVVVVGGPASVAPSVLAELATVLPGASVDRIEGADRYAVSRALFTSELIPGGPRAVVIADGRNYPDALSSVPAAAVSGGAVLLVDGSKELSADELALVRTYSGGQVGLIGGPASIDPAIRTQLESFTRVSPVVGADRFAVSLAMNEWAFGPTAFLASGLVFPDALAGGAAAGLLAAPLYLSRADCVPAGMVDQWVTDIGVERVTLLGGTSTLRSSVEALTECP